MEVVDDEDDRFSFKFGMKVRMRMSICNMEQLGYLRR